MKGNRVDSLNIDNVLVYQRQLVCHKQKRKRTVNVEVEGFFCAAGHIVSHAHVATRVRHLSSRHLLVREDGKTTTHTLLSLFMLDQNTNEWG